MLDTERFGKPEVRSAAELSGAAAFSYRRDVLRRIAIPKRPETRAARIAKATEFAARGERLPQT